MRNINCLAIVQGKTLVIVELKHKSRWYGATVDTVWLGAPLDRIRIGQNACFQGELVLGFEEGCTERG